MGRPGGRPVMSNNNVLEVKNLSVAYGKVEAVSGVSLAVGEGKIVTVIGPNGAGKTTTLSAIMGLLPSRGEVAFDGSIEQVPEVERMVVRGMNLVPEKRELFGEMSVRDNLLLGGFAASRRPLLGELHQFVQRLAPWRGILVFSHESRSCRGWWLGACRGASPSKRRLLR